MFRLLTSKSPKDSRWRQTYADVMCRQHNELAASMQLPKLETVEFIQLVKHAWLEGSGSGGRELVAPANASRPFVTFTFAYNCTAAKVVSVSQQLRLFDADQGKAIAFESGHAVPANGSGLSRFCSRFFNSSQGMHHACLSA